METPSSVKTPRVSAEKQGGLSQQDVETGSSNTGLDRTLHSRHLQFIAIGGTIGTGTLTQNCSRFIV